MTEYECLVWLLKQGYVFKRDKAQRWEFDRMMAQLNADPVPLLSLRLSVGDDDLWIYCQVMRCDDDRCAYN